MTDTDHSDWPKAVIFDLDGTLVDSAPDIASAINKLLRRDDLEPFSLPEVRGFIGHGIRRLVERAYDARKAPLAGQALDDKVAVFQDTYKDDIAAETRAYPGVLDLVATLRGKGIRTGICTNKTQVLTDALVDGLNIGSLFDAVVAGQSGIKAKPAADMLLETLRRLDCATDQAVMIGDSESDVACARAANVRVVGVTFGYTDIPMRDLGPDATIDLFSEALDAIDGLREPA